MFSKNRVEILESSARRNRDYSELAVNHVRIEGAVQQLEKSDEFEKSPHSTDYRVAENTRSDSDKDSQTLFSWKVPILNQKSKMK